MWQPAMRVLGQRGGLVGLKDEGQKEEGVESPREVRQRFLNFLEACEARHRGRQILLISHGDLLQIALTWVEGVPPGRHRSLRHLETAEIRPYRSAS